MSAPDSSGDLERLSKLLRGSAESAFGSADERLLRARFLERADGELARSGASKRHWLWAVPALAAALTLGFWALSSGPLDLDFEVEGAPRDGAYVRAASDRPATLRFSDQSLLVAAGGSRLRVEEAGARRARVLVERGRADVHVVHVTHREWTFVAGPFEVLVTGTRFALDWDPVSEIFDLSVSEGSVEVRGPTGAGPTAVRAGERFHGDVQRKSRLVVPAADKPAPKATASSEPAGSVPPAPASSGARERPPAAAGQDTRSARPAPPVSESWQERMTRGEFANIVAEAQARGIPQCLSGCSADELRALSDAARYTGKVELAEHSLLALHQRFGSGPGRDAAFSLGRLFEQRGDLGSAERWYDTYLRGAAAGTFAAEALAGKMRVVNKLRGPSAAAPVARDYLERFPNGVHRATARDIAGTD